MQGAALLSLTPDILYHVTSFLGGGSCIKDILALELCNSAIRDQLVNPNASTNALWMQFLDKVADPHHILTDFQKIMLANSVGIRRTVISLLNSACSFCSKPTSHFWLGTGSRLCGACYNVGEEMHALSWNDVLPKLLLPLMTSTKAERCANITILRPISKEVYAAFMSEGVDIRWIPMEDAWLLFGLEFNQLGNLPLMAIRLEIGHDQTDICAEFEILASPPDGLCRSSVINHKAITHFFISFSSAMERAMEFHRTQDNIYGAYCKKSEQLMSYALQQPMPLGACLKCLLEVERHGDPSPCCVNHPGFRYWTERLVSTRTLKLPAHHVFGFLQIVNTKFFNSRVDVIVSNFVPSQETSFAGINSSETSSFDVDHSASSAINFSDSESPDLSNLSSFFSETPEEIFADEIDELDSEMYRAEPESTKAFYLNSFLESQRDLKRQINYVNSFKKAIELVPEGGCILLADDVCSWEDDKILVTIDKPIRLLGLPSKLTGKKIDVLSFNNASVYVTAPCLLQDLRIVSGLPQSETGEDNDNYFSSLWITKDCTVIDCEITAYQGTNVVVDNGSVIIKYSTLKESPFYCFAVKNRGRILELRQNKILNNANGLFHPCGPQEPNMIENFIG